MAQLKNERQESEAHNIKMMAPWMTEMNLICSRAFCIVGMDPKGNVQAFGIPGMRSEEIAKYLEVVVKELRKPKKS